MATASGFDETTVPGRSVDAARTPERATLRKMQNKPAALIVCERWECALQGGVAGAVSILTQLFQAIGMVVHCTLLKTNPTVNKEAKDRGIKLCLPCEVVGLQLDALEPKSDWLMEHDNFFPDMRAIENVALVVGFELISSGHAIRIKRDLFPDAKIQIVNLWSHDLISERFLGLSTDTFCKRSVFLEKEFKSADVISSIGLNAFEFIRQRFIDVNTASGRHFRLSPVPEGKYFNLSPPLAELNGLIHICSLLDKHDADSLDKHIYLANVMKEVTESFVKMFTKPPKWKILGVPPGKESEIKKRLQTHTKLEVTCFSTTSLKEFDCELQTSHLVLIPPKAVNVLDLALTSMAIGVPVLAPKDSICHSFVEEFMEEFERDLLVNMNGNTAVLAETIIYTIKKHGAVLKKMKIIKQKLKEEVIPKIKETNDVFVKFMKTKLQMAEVDIETDHQTPRGVSHDTEIIPADRGDSQTVEGDGEQMQIQPDESSRHQSAETPDVGTPSGDEVYSSEPATQCSARQTDKCSESKQNEKGNTSELRPSERAVTQGQTLKRKRYSGESEKDDTDSDNSDTTSTSSVLSSEQGRNNCEVKVKLGIEGVVLVKGKSVKDVERALFPPRRRRTAMALKRKIRKLEEKAAKFRDVEVEMAKERAKIQTKLNKLHKELEVVDTETGSISFIMKCKSLEALECLMSEYSSGRLLKMMEDILVTPKVMKKLGVMYLSMQVIINMEEYQLCKKELLALQDSKRMKSRRNSVSSVYEIKSRKPTMSDLSPVSPHLHLIIPRQEHGRPTVHSLLGSSAVASEQGVTALLRRTGVCVFSRRHQQLKENKFRSVGKVITLQGMESDRLNILRSHKHQRDQDKTQSDNQEHSLLMEKFQLKRGKESTAERGYETAKKKNKLSEEITELDHQKAKLSEQMKDKDKELASLLLQLGQVEKGIVPKYTVRRLSRCGNRPGEVWWPWGLTINHNGQVVVSDYGVQEDDEYDEQPGSVKTVTADTAQIISTITFHDLPNIFRPTDVKMSENNLYYIADDGNKCILVCDAKSRLKQIIDIGEVEWPEICLGPDNTVFVADYNGRVIKYSKAGEMISSKQLSKPYITMNSKYQLIVSCENEHCIYVLDSNLNTLHTFGHEHLVRPWGVSVDAIGENIYVADENKVKIFSAQGEYLTDVTVDETPGFIAVFADGRIVYTASDDSDFSAGSVRVIYT